MPRRPPSGVSTPKGAGSVPLGPPRPRQQPSGGLPSYCPHRDLGPPVITITPQLYPHTSDSPATQVTPESVGVIFAILIRLGHRLNSGTSSSPRKDTPSPLPTLPTRGHPPTSCPCGSACLCWTPEVSGITQYVPFCVWLPPLSATVSRFICSYCRQHHAPLYSCVPPHCADASSST